MESKITNKVDFVAVYSIREIKIIESLVYFHERTKMGHVKYSMFVMLLCMQIHSSEWKECFGVAAYCLWFFFFFMLSECS